MSQKTSEKQLLVEELYAPSRKNFPRRRVIVRGYDDMWQADVVEKRPYARFNKGYNYILTVIDMLSKYAWAVPLKSYTPNWSTEVFKIVKVQKTNPVTYVLKDSCGNPVAGGFYEYELQRIANPDIHLVEKVIRKKGGKVYVKWLGFDTTHNSWIHKNNIL
ncbi:uncharacterized protein [Polyergus mexicanus]|uniref:uncharacterized protein n=1 Tax=Polyergus mexicanus TaxID=615972 RepID=UPI0038B68D0B